MAEQKPSPDAPRSRRRMAAAEIARIARGRLQELIGRPVTAVLGVERRDGGEWEVQVEAVEPQRVPGDPSAIGLYDVTLDDDGRMLECRRTRRWHPPAEAQFHRERDADVGLISALLTLPLAPVRGVAWTADVLVEEAERQLGDEDAIRREPAELESGDGDEISPEECHAREDRQDNG